MSKEDQFYVTLPSNSSYAYYGSQPTNKYRTRLHSHITLPPDASRLPPPRIVPLLA